jgi:mannose-6-phosphate isomerase-like protein (cupin superfamily)
MKKTLLVAALVFPVLMQVALAQRGSGGQAGPAQPAVDPMTLPLAQRIAHTDPSKYRPSPSVHKGAGQLDYMALFGGNAVDTNLWFLHRGIIEPKSGIGAHFHNNCEEMFVILDGEAQFTVDGRTSLLKGPAGAPTRMGHNHAIYNPTDKPVQWMNINVSQFKYVYDAFDLGDPRVGVAIDPIPVFMTMSLDKSLLRPVEGHLGGKGTVQYRRALDPTVFVGPWAYVDHLVIPPGASVGPNADPEFGGFYYVMSGDGKVTIGSETASIKTGDAVPLRLNDNKTFENTSAGPLEFLIVGVAKDPMKKYDLLARRGGGPPAGAGAGGGRGAGRGAGRGQ